jgi:hypothetical protein
MSDVTTALMTEYETLRRESLDSITHRTQIASFGLAGVGALFTAVALIQDFSAQSGLVIVLTSVAIPLSSALILVMWLGEFERMERAGCYLHWLESRINDHLGTRSLAWESWLAEGQARKPGPGTAAAERLKYPYFAVIGLFTLIGLGAPLAGGFLAGSEGTAWLLPVPAWIASIAVAAYAVVRVRNPKCRVPAETLHDWFKTSPDASAHLPDGPGPDGHGEAA